MFKAMARTYSAFLGFVRLMVADPSTEDYKPSTSRIVLWWFTLNWTAWVWLGIAEVDPLVLIILAFGPAVSLAFKKAPVEMAKTLLGALKNRSVTHLSKSTRYNLHRRPEGFRERPGVDMDELEP